MSLTKKQLKIFKDKFYQVTVKSGQTYIGDGNIMFKSSPKEWAEILNSLKEAPISSALPDYAKRLEALLRHAKIKKTKIMLKPPKFATIDRNSDYAMYWRKDSDWVIFVNQDIKAPINEQVFAITKTYYSILNRGKSGSIMFYGFKTKDGNLALVGEDDGITGIVLAQSARFTGLKYLDKDGKIAIDGLTVQDH